MAKFPKAILYQFSVDAMKSIYFTLLVAVLLVLTGCNTLITGEYINKHPQISALARGMTLERAMDIVKMRFDERIDDTSPGSVLTDVSSRTLISIDKAGVVYEYSSCSRYLGNVVREEALANMTQRTYEVKSDASSGKRELRFANVAVIKIYSGRPHHQLALLNDKGIEIGGFSVGDFSPVGHPTVENLSKEDINELIAALYFLCPNMHKGIEGGNS